MGKIDNNKQMKRESLLDSAFSLFIDNGFNKTSISDIVNNAGVAKGTFYLYFKDKYDIRNHLIAHKASQIFQAAYFHHRQYPRPVCRQPQPRDAYFQASELGILQKFSYLCSVCRHAGHLHYL